MTQTRRLPTQLFVGSRPTPEGFQEPRNDFLMCAAHKPRGGLWTSTYSPEHGSAWVQLWLDEDFGVSGGGRESWLLEPDPAARVLEIDSYADLRRVSASYSHSSVEYVRLWTTLDFERLAVDYDAIHLTEAGQETTRLTHPLNLYGWDCESVLWLRWAFVGEPHALGRRTWAPSRSA